MDYNKLDFASIRTLTNKQDSLYKSDFERYHS